MKRTLFLLLAALILTGCVPLSGPSGSAGGETAPIDETIAIPKTPSSASFVLTRWDGETLLGQFCYTPEDIDALAQALPEVRGSVPEAWTVPEEPWPIYGLRIGGTEQDYEAAYCDGVFLDSQGRVLRAEVDFGALWERFADEPKEFYLPCRRELALSGGVWDSRFLTASGAEEPLPDVPMELAVNGETVFWTVTNYSGQALSHSNGGGAGLEVLLDGVWYGVPTVSGAHYAVTAEGHTLPDGESYSYTLWREKYGDLPDGTYRVVFGFSPAASAAGTPPSCGFSAAVFQMKDGAPVSMEEPA